MYILKPLEYFIGRFKMTNKMDVLVGALVLITGFIMYSFAPGGLFFQKPPAHTMTHFIGGGLAIIFGLLGIALYKKMSTIGIAVSFLSLILGIIFILDAPDYPLYTVIIPHNLAIQLIGVLTGATGAIGAIQGFVGKPKSLE